MKFIATYAPTSFGYIISVLAMVTGLINVAIYIFRLHVTLNHFEKKNSHQTSFLPKFICKFWDRTVCVFEMEGKIIKQYLK
jgi:hypothetical protein